MEPSAPVGPISQQNGQAFPVEIVRSGYAVDDRGFSREFIEQLCENTKLMMGAAGAGVPAQRGHNLDDKGNVIDDKIPLEGLIENLRVAPSSEDPAEIALCGDMRLWSSLLTDYQMGSYPTRSIFYAPTGTLPNGRLVGPYLRHVALYGAVPVAMPGLGEATLAAQTGLIRRMVNGLRTYFGGGSKAEALAALTEPTEPVKEAAMAAPAVAKNPALEACESMMKGLQTLMGMLADGPGGPPAVEVEVEKEEEPPMMEDAYAAAKPAATSPKDEPADTALSARVQSLESRLAEASYAKFAAEGRAGKDDASKSLFLRIVQTDGLDAAERRYSAITPIAPPQFEFRDQGNDPNTALKSAEVMQAANRLGVGPETMKYLTKKAS